MTSGGVCDMICSTKQGEGGHGMRILYRQAQGNTTLGEYGISELCFKKLSLQSDRAVISAKVHRHSEFELHLVTSGCQYYEIEGDSVCVDAGCFLLIAPNVQHRAMSFDEHTEKYALTFQYAACAPFFDIPNAFSFALRSIPNESMEGLLFAEGELLHKTKLSQRLAENRLFELLTSIFRSVGLKENTETIQGLPTHAVLSLAIRYIEDNIECAPTVYELASYCHLSERQLSRIFLRHEAKTPFEFIRLRRIERAKELLQDTSLSLFEISERMSFPSEYYFNQFFKSGYGMPPGAYRKSVKQS